MLFGDLSVSTMFWKHQQSHFNMILQKICFHKKNTDFYIFSRGCIPDFDLLHHLAAIAVFKILGSKNRNMPAVERTLPTCNVCGTGLVKDWPGHCGPVACNERNQTKWASTFWIRVCFHWTKHAKNSPVQHWNRGIHDHDQPPNKNNYHICVGLVEESCGCHGSDKQTDIPL